MEVEDDLFYYGLLEQCTITDDDEEEEEEPVLEKSSMVVCCTPVLDHKEQDEKSTTTPETTPQPDSTTTTSTSTIIHYYTPEDSFAVSNETETDRHDGECWPRLVSINNNDEDTTDGDTSQGGDPNDWEVLSVASSVWTLDTFAETTKSFLEVLVEERSSSSSLVMVRPPALETGIPSSIDGPPKTTSRPASTEKAPRKLKKLVGGDDDHIEDPDNMVLCWDSIRDDYKNGRGGRLSRRFKGNPKRP
jgi:hypothetical protein